MANPKQLGLSDLEKAGKALYGERWQTDLAHALGLKDARRIRQWMAEDRPIPPGVWNDIADLLRSRGKAAVVLADEIHKSAPEEQKK